MNPSDALAHFLAQPDLENDRLTAYKDSGGVLTIGVGHTGNDVTAGETETYAKSIADLEANMATAAATVNKLLKVPAQQWEFDALVSLGFNIGIGAISHATCIDAFNSGCKGAVPYKIKLWNKVAGAYSRGLDKRRRAEAILFLGPPWQVAKFANDDIDVLSTATLTRIMAAYQ
jgi:lysozyme